MLKSKINNLKLHMWYYKKSSKQLLFTDLILLMLASATIIKELNSICLIYVYFMVYFTSCIDMISFSNSALACTTLKIKDSICGTSFIIWAKSTLIILIALIFKAINVVLTSTEFNYSWLINFLKYAIVSYPILKFLSVASYCVTKKYRNLLTCFIITIASFTCLELNQLSPLWNFFSFVATSILTLLVAHILIKKLTYETIFFKEAER